MRDVARQQDGIVSRHQAMELGMSRASYRDYQTWLARQDPSRVHAPSPDQRRIAAERFEHARRAVNTGNHDYAVQLLLTCCEVDPRNFVFRQTLRRTQKAKYKNNLRGSRLAFLTTLHLLPARQRAVLILRDVLAWKADEVATLLDISAASANPSNFRPASKTSSAAGAARSS